MAPLFTLTACHETRTTLIRPPDCVVADWPAFPDVHLNKDCPAGTKCLPDAAYLKIVTWIDQANRWHDSVDVCPEIKVRSAPTQDHVSP